MVQKTRIMDVYKHLKDNKIDVYFPTQKQGECIAPYVVLKDAGTMKYQDFSSTQSLYDVMCYVPKNNFSKLDQFVSKVKNLMKQMEPMIQPTYFETPSYYDDGVKAHMVSVQYRNMRKIV